MESDSFIFDDDVEEIGSDVEAFCPKCKADTAHTIITKYEDEIRRVQCSPCGDVHAFRKPRGEVEEAEAEEKASKKKQLKRLTWEEFFAKHDPNLARPYSFRDTYIENDIVTHPKFGLGFASDNPDEDKVEITFKDSRRVLVHNRKELPGAPPELARPPKPRPTPKDLKGKKGKGGAAAAAGPAGLSAKELAKQEKELAKQKAAEAKAAAAAKKAAEKEKARLKKEKEREAKAAAKAKAAEKKAAAKAKAEAKKAALRAKAEAKKAAAKAKAEAAKAQKAKAAAKAAAAKTKVRAAKKAKKTARPAAKAKKKK